MNVFNVEILSGIFPDETGAAVSDKQFRFAHLDVKVYQSTKDALDWLWPRIIPGGIVVFNDYGTYGCEGVTRLVNEVAVRDDRLFLHNLNGPAYSYDARSKRHFEFHVCGRKFPPGTCKVQVAQLHVKYAR